MSSTPPVSSGNSDAAIEKMSATFDMAIEKSAKITEISTAKKQSWTRPSNVRRTDVAMRAASPLPASSLHEKSCDRQFYPALTCRFR
ncbi:hypothetical protein KIH13_20290 [Pseudomonas viridiflava]|nr:hypothetical protein KIH13_20290 [Pseudomonas viridiflava]